MSLQGGASYVCAGARASCVRVRVMRYARARASRGIDSRAGFIARARRARGIHRSREKRPAAARSRSRAPAARSPVQSARPAC